MINNRFNVVYHLLGLVKLLFYKLQNMNLKIKIKEIENHTKSWWNNLSEEDKFEILYHKKFHKLTNLKWDDLPAPLRLNLLIEGYKTII